jgi:hypothetical protein
MVEHRYEMNRVGDFGRCACGQEIKIITDPRDFKKTSQEITKPGDPDYQHPKIEVKQPLWPGGKTADEILAGLPAFKPVDLKAPDLFPPVPPKPEGSTWAISQYYDAHRKEIEKEVKTIGVQDALTRWGIKSGTWSMLVKKWARQDAKAAALPGLAKQIETPRETIFDRCESHKDEIIRDYHDLTLESFYAKWHISAMTWIELKRRWNVQGKGRGYRKHETLTVSKGVIECEKVSQGVIQPTENIPIFIHGNFPPFPAFSDRWRENVQIAWLNAYIRLKELR